MEKELLPGNSLYIINKAKEWAIEFVPMLLLAILTLVVGFWIVKRILVLISATLERTNLSLEINQFFLSLAELALKLAVILMAASFIGFQTSSLISLLAAVAFAVGLAMQGFLGNFAAGITIVFLKPYKVGDWVEISEKFGKVTGVQIFNTTLQTPGKKTLVIPNGKVTDNVITNFSTEGYIRLELKVTMPYEESFPKVRQTIEKALSDAPFILLDPPPQIGILEYDSHSIVVSVRPFIRPDDYWDVTFDLLGRIKAAFHENDIKVAYSEGVELGAIGE